MAVPGKEEGMRTRGVEGIQEKRQIPPSCYGESLSSLREGSGHKRKGSTEGSLRTSK